jgi:hypothetical protein
MNEKERKRVFWKEVENWGKENSRREAFGCEATAY